MAAAIGRDARWGWLWNQDSATALSQHTPVRPTERAMLAASRAWPISADVYWADSTGGRNTSMMEVVVFKHQQVAAVREMRGKMWSPGRPSTFRREHRVKFWEAIGRGLSTEDAAAEVGMSAAVGARWFREAGGMPSVELVPVSGRYLSFAEREEIAIFYDRGVDDPPAINQLHILDALVPPPKSKASRD